MFVCNSLVVEGREGELGLVVVDEVHMLGEQGRGANLECFLTKLLYVRDQRQTGVQIVAIECHSGELQGVGHLSEGGLVH